MAKKPTNFISKYTDDKKFERGGRKSDSNYYRRKLRGRKIAAINYLVRNTNQLVVTASISNPEFKSGLIDRFLILAHIEEVEPIIVLTKTDLIISPDCIENYSKMYLDAGYHVIAVSSVSGEGLEELTKILTDRTSAIVGHSGVGKTSMLNAIDPVYSEKVKEISSLTGRGCHTTTRVKMHEFHFGGIIYDMPGLKEIDFLTLEKEDLKNYYPEFEGLSSGCKFSNCVHIREEQCGVKAALSAGTISAERYQNYKNIYDSIPN